MDNFNSLILRRLQINILMIGVTKSRLIFNSNNNNNNNNTIK